MSEFTHVEWCHSTFNPWIGCSKVGPGCDNCYAEAMMDTRLQKVQWGAGNPRTRTGASNWRGSLSWNAKHAEFFAEHGCRRRVFCASLADVFDNEIDQQWREDLWALILATPNLDWLLLTKRIGNVRKMVPASWLVDGGWPAHVRLGITVVNQNEADRDIGALLALPCPNFLSIEPLLAAINLDSVYVALPGVKWLDWVIVGGESGAFARLMHPDWVRLLRDQCAAAGVPFLFKQWGEWRPAVSIVEATNYPKIVTNRAIAATTEQSRRFKPASGCFHMAHQVESMIDGLGEYAHLDCAMFQAGKKAAGRLIDGVQHDGYPSRAAEQKKKEMLLLLTGSAHGFSQRTPA